MNSCHALLALVLALSVGVTTSAARARQQGVKAPACPEFDPPALPVVFPVHLADGKTVSSHAEPQVAFGRVEVRDGTGEIAFLDLDSVDLERSQRAWADLAPWAHLDSHPIVGTALPELRYVDARGTVRSAPGGGDEELRLIELWAAWCIPCHAQLQAERRWQAACAADADLHVTTLCVDCEPRTWRRILRSRGFSDGPGWTNGIVAEESIPVAKRLMGPRAKLNLLVDAEGRVVHAVMEPHGQSYEPRVLAAVVREPRARAVQAVGSRVATTSSSDAIAPEPSPGEKPPFVSLDGAAACQSEARQITFKSDGGDASRVARVLGLVAGKPIEAAIDLTTVKVVTRLESVPWDCVVQELARQLELEVVLEADRIRLVPPVGRAGASPPD